MKKVRLALLISNFTLVAQAQVTLTMSPDQGTPGQYLTTTITASSMIFQTGSPYGYLQHSSTGFQLQPWYGNWTIDASTVQETFNIPTNAPAGYYDLHMDVYQWFYWYYYTDSYLQPNAFYITCTSQCNTPTNLLTSNIAATHAKLKWTTVDCAPGYQVKYRPVGSSTWITKNVNGNIGYKNISGLAPNTSYQWRIRTKCSINPVVWSAWSTTATFATPLKLDGEEEEITLNLYPNPVTDQLTIETDQKVDFIIIQNLLGEIVFEESVEGNEIDVSTLPGGVYLLTAYISQSKAAKMFLKE